MGNLPPCSDVAGENSFALGGDLTLPRKLVLSYANADGLGTHRYLGSIGRPRASYSAENCKTERLLNVLDRRTVGVISYSSRVSTNIIPLLG